MPQGFVDVREFLAGHPALRGLSRVDLARALYVHDRYVLPEELMQVLGRGPSVVLRARGPAEIRNAVRVANGELSTQSLGLSARHFHFVRTQLGMRRGYEVPVDYMRVVDTYDDQVIPQQGGFLLDLTGIDSVEVRPDSLTVEAGVGARWKDVQDQALAAGLSLNHFPFLPMDFALGDMMGAPFLSSYGGSLHGMRNVKVVLPDGSPCSLGYDGVPSNGSGYDLMDLFMTAGQHIAIPYSFTFTASPRPKGSKTLFYSFNDIAGLAAAVKKLSQVRLRAERILFYDLVAWSSSHRSEVPGPTLEVTLAQPEASMASAEKVLDTVTEGRLSKEQGVSVLDAPAAEFRRSTRALKSAVGEIRVPVGNLTGAYEVASGITPGTGVFGTLSRNTACLIPTLRRPLSRRERFDYVAALVEGMGADGVVAGPQILLLLADRGPMAKGFEALRRIKDKVDLPNTVNPARALLYPTEA